MNAIIGLCHFCEAHGPRPLMCTYVGPSSISSDTSSAQCIGCSSLGANTVFVSKDGNVEYCTRDTLPSAEAAALLRQAAVRSITCEVSWNKDGGVVYFDEVKCHILSFTFQLKDTRARGLKRWFSIVVLMKDKMLLLNLTTMLSEHMKKVATELQELADRVYEQEQQICSQRALRLNTGRNDFGPSRSLPQLTGDKEIFRKIHSHFIYMLKTGAISYTESLYTSQDLLNKFKSSGVQIYDSNMVDRVDKISLLAVQNILGPDAFRIALFCALTGVRIILKTNHTDSKLLVGGLSRLVPIKSIQPGIHQTNSPKFTPSESVCYLEEVNGGKFLVKWPRALPARCPQLMTKIEMAVNFPKSTEERVNQLVQSLMQEWLVLVQTLKSAAKTSKSIEAISNLRKVLGVTDRDEALIRFWSDNYCDNNIV